MSLLRTLPSILTQGMAYYIVHLPTAPLSYLFYGCFQTGAEFANRSMRCCKQVTFLFIYLLDFPRERINLGEIGREGEIYSLAFGCQ